MGVGFSPFLISVRMLEGCVYARRGEEYRQMNHEECKFTQIGCKSMIQKVLVDTTLRL